MIKTVTIDSATELEVQTENNAEMYAEVCSAVYALLEMVKEKAEEEIGKAEAVMLVTMAMKDCLTTLYPETKMTKGESDAIN